MTDAGPTATPASCRHHVLVVDADPALSTLIEEWLGAMGCAVAADPGDGTSDGPFDLAIVDLPHARTGGSDRIRRLAERHPGVPILALSPAFFPGVHACGPVARALGADCVLAQPASHAALTAAVRHLLDR